MKFLRYILCATLLCFFPAISRAQANFANGSITTTSSTCATATSCVQFSFSQDQVSWISITVSGTFSGTLQFEGTADGTGPYSLGCTTLAAGPSGTPVTSATAAGVWQCKVSGLTFTDVRASALASGTAVVQITGSRN